MITGLHLSRAKHDASTSVIVLRFVQNLHWASCQPCMQTAIHYLLSHTEPPAITTAQGWATHLNLSISLGMLFFCYKVLLLCYLQFVRVNPSFHLRSYNCLKTNWNVNCLLYKNLSFKKVAGESSCFFRTFQLTGKGMMLRIYDQLILPSSNCSLMPDFMLLLPAGITCCWLSTTLY